MDSKHQAEAGVSGWLLTLGGKAVYKGSLPVYVQAHTWYEGVQEARRLHGANYSVCPVDQVQALLDEACASPKVCSCPKVPTVNPEVTIYDAGVVGRRMTVRIELDFPNDHDMAAREVVALIRSKLHDAPFKVGIVQTFASPPATTRVVAGGSDG